MAKTQGPDQKTIGGIQLRQIRRRHRCRQVGQLAIETLVRQ